MMTNKKFMSTLYQGLKIESFEIENDINFMLLPSGDFSDIVDVEIKIMDSVFQKVVGACIHFKKAIHIENCIFKGDVIFHGAFFHKSFLIKNSHFLGAIDFSSCSFKSSVKLNKNKFDKPVTFIGSDFQKDVELSDNDFTKGTNLLDEVTNRISFKDTPALKNNKGNLTNHDIG